MPWMPAHPCNYPGCAALIESPAVRYCKAHERPAYQRPNDSRPNSCKRGYNYAWQKFRQWYLTQHPLCLDCLDAGRYTPATDIHHIEKLRASPAKKTQRDNLRPLCHECHSARTRKGE